MADALQGLDRGDDIGNIGTSVLFCGGSMLALNYLGTEVWKMCDGLAVDDIVTNLLPQFEVEEDVLRADIVSFIDELATKGFIHYAE